MSEYSASTLPVKSNFSEVTYEQWLTMRCSMGGAIFIRCGRGFGVCDLIDKFMAAEVIRIEDGKFAIADIAAEVLLDDDPTFFPLITGSVIARLPIGGNA